MLKEAIGEAYAQLQSEAGRAHGHLLDWARDHLTETCRLLTRLLPRPLPAPLENSDPISQIGGEDARILAAYLRK